MITRVFSQLWIQLFSRVFTNAFPAPHMPPSLTEALAKPEALVPPVPVDKHFRGRLDYDRAKCIGCRLCIKVCPANAIKSQAEEKKIIIHNDRCCFCAQCTEICPVKCLAMSDTYMISSYERKENLVTDSGPATAKN